MEVLRNGEIFSKEIISRVYEFTLSLRKQISELLNGNYFSNEDKSLLSKQAQILFLQIGKGVSNMKLLPFHTSLIEYCIVNNLFDQSQIEYIKNLFGDRFNEFNGYTIDFGLLKSFLRLLKSSEIQNIETLTIPTN